MIRKMQTTALPITSQGNTAKPIALRMIALGSAALLLAAALMVQPAHAEQTGAQGDVPAPLSVMIDTLPHDFAAKAEQAGLTVVEIEVLEALGSHIVHIRTAKAEAQDVTFSVLQASFPSADFERLGGVDDDFSTLDF